MLNRQPIDQLLARLPQPPTKSGSKDRTNTGCPRFWLSILAHSPFAAGLLRSQSGTKSLSRRSTRVSSSWPCGSIGFMSRSLLLAVMASRYLPMLNLTAVFPFPNRS